MSWDGYKYFSSRTLFLSNTDPLDARGLTAGRKNSIIRLIFVWVDNVYCLTTAHKNLTTLNNFETL